MQFSFQLSAVSSQLKYSFSALAVGNGLAGGKKKAPLDAP
jgi:hypothetical protein